METLTDAPSIVLTLALVMVVTLGVPALAQQTITVNSIEYQGLKVWGRQDVQPIIRNQGLQVGNSYTREEFNNTVEDVIQRLQDEGLFSDIQVSRNDGTVIFQFEEFNRITNIKFQGNSIYDDSKLRDVLLLQVGGPANPFEINQGKRDLLNFYRQEGYSSVEVSVETETTKRGRTIVTYGIKAGKQRTVNNIELEYDPDPTTLEAIHRNFSLRMILPLKKGQPYSSQARKRSVRAIKSWYATNGYLDASVDVKLWRNLDDGGIDVRFVIHQGPQYNLGNVKFVGNELFSDTRLRGIFPIEQGNVFSSRLFQKGKREISRTYEDRGYAEVNVSSSIQRTGTDTQPIVNLTMRVREGQPIYVERIEILGNVKTYDRVIRREIRLEPGKLLDGEKKRNSLRRLRNLGFFKEVKMNVVPGSRENWKIVRVRVKEGRTGQFQFGGGFSSSTGFTGNLSVRKDNFSLWDPYHAFTGRGQSLQVSAQVGERQNNFNISWNDPWFNDSFENPSQPSPEVPIGLGWSAFNVTNDREEGYDEIRQGGSISLSREFGPARSNQMDVELAGKTTRVENVDASNSDIPIDIINEASGDGEFERTINTVRLGLQRDRRDNRLFPTEGYYLRGSLRTAAEAIGADVNFYNPELDARSYVPFLGSTFWAFRLNYKTIDSWSDEANAVPSFEKFFLGGNRTVRGYDFRDILIYDNSGNRVAGGQTAYFSNLEWRFPVMEQTMQLYGFTDFGAVYRDSWKLGTDKIKQSAGVGIRVRSPMGPINISWAQRLDNTFPGAGDKGETQIDFNIGTGF